MAQIKSTESGFEDSRLTENDLWDDRWARIKLPAEVRRDTDNRVAKEILKVFDSFLPRKKGLSILEIGGAPGNFLAYFKGIDNLL